jgi:hypothetical protein
MARLRPRRRGVQVWHQWTAAQDAYIQRAAADGCSLRDIAEDLHPSLSAAHVWRRLRRLAAPRPPPPPPRLKTPAPSAPAAAPTKAEHLTRSRATSWAALEREIDRRVAWWVSNTPTCAEITRTKQREKRLADMRTTNG